MQGTANREQGTGQRYGEQRRRAVAGALFGLVTLLSSAQQIDLGGKNPAAEAKKQHVVLLSEAVEVKAGGVQDVELRFRVEPGFHINSHTPKDELLIPTGLKLEDSAGLKVVGQDYPAGTPFRLSLGDGPGETLDVYQGEFRVRLRVKAAARGTTMLNGTLRYQACDNAACFPPRTLPVKAIVTAK